LSAEEVNTLPALAGGVFSSIGRLAYKRGDTVRTESHASFSSAYAGEFAQGRDQVITMTTGNPLNMLPRYVYPPETVATLTLGT